MTIRCLSGLFQKETIVTFCHFDYRNYTIFSFLWISGGDPRILGIYENQKYTNQNKYHYVNITCDLPNSVYLWKNRVNRVYKLHPIAKQNELRVDENVDYYSSANWKIAKVDNESIYDPYNELHRKMDCFGKIYCFTL